MDYTHGNYCGHTWSNGRFQDSVCGDLPPVDAFDLSCKGHDCCLYKAGDDPSAQTVCNEEFFRENFGQGTIRSAAALAVRYGQRPARIAAETMKRFRGISWDLTGKGPFDTKNFVGDSWNYEDLKGNCRSDMESRYMKSSNQKRRRISNPNSSIPYAGKKRNIGMSGERSVKRRVEKNYTPVGSKRVLFKDPIVQRRRGFAQLPREWRVAHANYLRAKYRLRRGAYRRQRIAKARTLRGMFARGRAANRIKTLVALSEA